MKEDYHDKTVNGYVVTQTAAQHTVVYFSTDSAKVNGGYNLCFGNVT